MKIFITGIAGFLGSHLADRMIELGHEVVGNDTLIGGYQDNVPKKAKFYVVDCCDNEKMTYIMEGCDIVIHCAATAHEGLSVFSPSFITRNIFEASVSTISAAIQNNVKRFVYCTSMARYGDQVAPFSEDMPTKPVDPYGIAKAAGEEVLKALCDTHGMEWNIAVPHNIVGPRQRYDDPFRNVMSIMINRNLQGKPAIVYGDGLQTRCFSYVADCINCLEKMALDPNIVGEIINIGPDEGTITVAEVASLVAKECGNITNTWPPIHMPDRPREVKHASCTADKARKLLNYETKTDLIKAIAETVDYIKKKGPKPFDYTYPLEIISDKTPKTWKDRLM
jgi:UDP-glucose 4-epimerase